VEDGSPSAYLMEASSRRDQVSARRGGASTPKRITFDSRVETGGLVEGRQKKNYNAQGRDRSDSRVETGVLVEENHAGFKFRTRPHVWMKPARISGWNRTYASVPTNVKKSSGSTRRGIPVHQHCANSLSATGTRPTNPEGGMSGKASTTTTRSETQYGMGQPPPPTVLVPRALTAAHERSANERAAGRHPSMGANGTLTTGSSTINEKKNTDEKVGSKVCGAAASTSTSTSTKPNLEQFPQAQATLIEEMKQQIAHIKAEMEKQKEALAEAEQAERDITSSAAKEANLKDRFSIVGIPQ